MKAATHPEKSEYKQLRSLREGWQKPARTYRPHTRWWWPGSALSKEDITRQMEQMAAQGMGGVEIMNTWKFYEKGNNEYGSPRHLELVRHAVQEGKRLDLEVSITFGPGWSFGGAWVSKEDTSKSLVKGELEIAGPAEYDGPLPVYSAESFQVHSSELNPEWRGLVAVIAARAASSQNDGTQEAEGLSLEADSLTLLTSQVKGNQLVWNVPEGRWRIMAFYLMYTGQVCQANSFLPDPLVIDHLSKAAVERYCEYLGGIFQSEVGEEFGKTVDSLFTDSFEVVALPDGLLWSDLVLAEFEKETGYDFTPYLPVLWHDLGELTPRLRYDMNLFLHNLGMKTFFKTFADWCESRGLQAKVQPHYRFTTEIIQASGSIPRPETEVTTARFATIPDPRKASASGMRFYGGSHLSAEAYTFVNRFRYRTELKQLKMATDAFLRDGVTQLYNHGYFASPEQYPDPTRHVPWANLINHQNVWWKYYHHLAEYVGRCCYMLRQGKVVTDILIYSPHAEVWSKRAVWGWDRRVMPYGDLPMTLLANGFDYDLVNDDLLQHHARIKDGHFEINGYSRRILILPDVSVIPLATIKRIAQFAEEGGVVIALGRLPQIAAGLKDCKSQDEELRRIVRELFHEQRVPTAHAMPDFRIGETELDPFNQEWKPQPPLNADKVSLLGLIGKYAQPGMAIEDRRQSDGLTFVHTRKDEVDVIFVTNLQPQPIRADVTFNVTGKAVQKWDARTGQISPTSYSFTDWNGKAGMEGTVIRLELSEWESVFYVFAPEENLEGGKLPQTTAIDLRPSEELNLEGIWRMKLEGHGFEAFEGETEQLRSWTESPRTRHFSGTGRYDIEFQVAWEFMDGNDEFILDLGEVGMIAEVELNGHPVGTAWMPPYRLNLTEAIRVGANRLTIEVTNVWLNYINGLKEPTPVPAELSERLGEQSAMLNSSEKRWQRLFVEMKKDERQLPPSGLLGPVKISGFAVVGRKEN